jgi:uncharacterized protein (TIGR03435 family)
VFAIGSLQPSHGQAPSAASAAASQAAGPGADAAAVQTPPAGSFPQFAVVSIKPDKSDAKPQFRFNADGISARKYTPLWLLVAAYDLVEEDRVIGWPAWMLNEYYDVDAKLDEADVPAFAKLSPNDKLLLMQQFFPTRFNMKFHWESRDFKIYELVVAKGGPKLGKPRPLTDEPIPHTLGRWNMKFEAVTMAELCLYILSTEAQLLVVDKTGLTGRYDFSLQWSRPDELVNGQPSDQPLIFTALQEQLGLKLVPAVQPTRVLVIDHIERPSGN